MPHGTRRGEVQVNMTRVTRTIIFLFIITAMVVTASAGTIGGSTAGANAGVSGNGIAASYDWNAQYEAGIDQMGAVNQAGQSFSTSTTDNSQAGTNPGEFPEFMVMVKAKEIKISGQVTGPSGDPGSAMAIASVRALANREFEETGATQEDLSLETWIFAATHTYAGAEGVTATASATASGTATASAATDLGSAKAESKGKVTASSSATYANGNPSQSAAAGIIYAAAHADEKMLDAGYPVFEFTPLYLFHPEVGMLDPLLFPYLYPGNGLVAMSLQDGTGNARASASGSAEASADILRAELAPASSTGCTIEYEPVVETESSGQVSTAVTGTDAMSGAISGINAWALAPNPMTGDGSVGAQQELQLVALLDAGSNIYAAGGSVNKSASGTGLTTPMVSAKTKKMKLPVTQDSATFSASGSSSGSITIGGPEGDLSPFIDGPGIDIEAESSGSISGSVTRDNGNAAAGSANIIAARGLGNMEESSGIMAIDWGILLPSTYNLNNVMYGIGAGEGTLYSMIGSASGSMADSGIGTTSAIISKASAEASGSGSYGLLFSANENSGPDIPMPGISGETEASGTITSATKASDYGEAATTSQILAAGGEGPVYGYLELDYMGTEEIGTFQAEVGGMAYLTTMDYAKDTYSYSGGNSLGISGTSRNSRMAPPATSIATSSVSGEAEFEGSSIMVNDFAPIPMPAQPASGTIARGGGNANDLGWLWDGEIHEASAEAEGKVTGSTSVNSPGEADTGSLIFSAALAEEEVNLGRGVGDYSLILSDSSATSMGALAQTASAKGTAAGSTESESAVVYTNFIDLGPGPDPSTPFLIIRWAGYDESETEAEGSMTTEAKACGNSNSSAVTELKSVNLISDPTFVAIIDIGPPFQGGEVQVAGVINDDSVLASFADIDGGAISSDSSSATASQTGSTSSEGDIGAIMDQLIYPPPTGAPVSISSGTQPVAQSLPYWQTLDAEFLNGETSVGNADKATVSGSGNGVTYNGTAANWACADQMTAYAGSTKTALAQGTFGTVAVRDNTSAVTAEATISKVKVNAFADPDGTWAEIGVTGGAASSKVMPTAPYGKFTGPTYSSLTYEVFPIPPGGTAVGSAGITIPQMGVAASELVVVADSRNFYPDIPDSPDFPEILHPAEFWS